jgi:hypothetical protein
MDLDFKKSAPQVHSLEEARALIDYLWTTVVRLQSQDPASVPMAPTAPSVSSSAPTALGQRSTRLGGLPPAPTSSAPPGESPSGVKLQGLPDGLINASGRLEYGILKQMAEHIEESDFLRILPFPVLMGSALFRGFLMPEQSGASSGDGEATMMFRPAKTTADDRASKLKILERAIYPLLKRRGPSGSPGPKDVLSVGRSPESDIFMQDRSISNKHAEIRYTAGGSSGNGYFLRDLGSTNGTLVNGRPIKPFAITEVSENDELKFGRYSFTFLASRALYARLTGKN